MAIQFVRDQIVNNAINSTKMDLSNSSNYTFLGDVQVPATPAATNSAVSKSYVDGLLQGLHWKKACVLATTANYAATYNNGASGVGATLTANASGVVTFDGTAFAINDRILFKDQTSALQNGIYTCTTLGAVGVAAVFTRADDTDVPSEIPSAAVLIVGGVQNDNQGFVCSNNADPTIGTDAINFVQFTGAGQIVAGNGLAKNGNTLSVNVDDSTIEINGDALRVKDDGITADKIAAGAIGSTELADDSVIAAKIADDAVTGAAIATNAVTADSIAAAAVGVSELGAIAGVGLSGGSGSALALDLNELSAANVASGDKLSFVDVTDNSSKLDTVDDLATLFAGVGLSAASAVLAIDLNELTGATVNVANDSIAIIDADDNSTKKESISDLMTAVAGAGINSAGGTIDVDTDETTIEVNVGTNKVQVKNLGITSGKLANDSVLTTKILDGNVTFAKINDVNANSIIVRDANSAGSVSAKGMADTQLLICNGAGFTGAALSGDVTMLNTGAVTIGNDKITTAKINAGAVTNAELGNAAVDFTKLEFQPRVQAFTGSATATFTLTTRLTDTTWRKAAIVSRNGQILNYVSSLTADGQFTLADNGTNTILTLNSAITASETVSVVYFA